MTSFRERIQAQDGSAMIELALVVPLIAAMVVGVANFGILLQRNIAVADSARAGAEYALLAGRHTDTTNMAYVANSVAGSIPGYSAYAANICACSPGGIAVPCSTTCSSYGQPAMYAQVTASANLPMIFGTGTSIPVRSTVRIRISCPAC